MGRGYAETKRGGVHKYVHVVVAEQALGRALPDGAQVHHVDGDRKNNTHANLVICNDRMYHELLHTRTAALDACGNASWRKCNICKQYDSPDNLQFRKHGNVQHKRCASAYRAARRAVQVAA